MYQPINMSGAPRSSSRKNGSDGLISHKAYPVNKSGTPSQQPRKQQRWIAFPQS